MQKMILAAAAAAVLLMAVSASAHVTLQPKQAPADSFVRLNVRVPNERDNARTRKVQVQFPPGVLALSYEPVDGWQIAVTKRKLDRPAELHGDPVDEEIDEVSFTAQKGASIRPGQFRDFGLSLRTPAKPNRALTFKALQTYSGGEVVRWIGLPDSEEPAAQVQLISAAQAEQAQDSAATASAVRTAAATNEDGPSTALVIAALVMGGLGLLAGLGALLSVRRASRWAR
jgi:periplasmic copper chaperone A